MFKVKENKWRSVHKNLFKTMLLLIALAIVLLIKHFLE